MDAAKDEKTLVSVPDGLPASLRVLVVDDSPTCLVMIETMAKCYFNEVTACRKAEEALSILRDNKNKFDILICDMHMPEMDGLKLLETIRLEMDLPVVIVSGDDRKEVVMKGLVLGACDYLLKPVRKETIGTIWQHVVRKKRNNMDRLGIVEDNQIHETLADECDGNGESSRKRENGEHENREEYRDVTISKKPRMIWTDELHQKFVEAVNEIGLENAVPKKILESMERKNVMGLTRNNIASHLQKYRLNIPRLNVKLGRENEDSRCLLQSNIFSHEQSSSSDGPDMQVRTSSAVVPFVVPINHIVPESSNCYPASNNTVFCELGVGNDPLLYLPYKYEQSSRFPSLRADFVPGNVENLLQQPKHVTAEDENDFIPELIYETSLTSFMADHLLN